MHKEFLQTTWDDEVRHACRQLVQLAVLEDLSREQDWTTLATVPDGRRGAAAFVARTQGIVAGLSALDVVIEQTGADLKLTRCLEEGAPCQEAQTIATLEGNVRDMLACERILLNFLCRMMGIASHVHLHVAELQKASPTSGRPVRLYDTRKTTPGWRVLEKYAVRCGGGANHRRGLYDAILIKDNHLAQLASPDRTPAETAAHAVRLAKAFIAECDGADLAERSSRDAEQGGACDRGVGDQKGPGKIIEIEVDTLDQLVAVLPEGPDIVLLDNMAAPQLRQAVTLRDRIAPHVQLEASGGVSLKTLQAIAETGVDRISMGGLTHAAHWLDVGLDWR